MTRKLLPAAALAFLLAPAYLAFQKQQADPHAGHKHGPGEGNVTERMPDYHQSEASARPFPPTLDPNGFKHPAVRRAYQIAKEIPGVLAQQPCYCYCDRMGHKGLLACHRDTHSAG